MKANRNFREADEAVSPVIGVILMVAITVVLAAVVFVLVSDLGDTGSSAPEVSFSKDEEDDQMKVAKAETGLNWTAFEIRANKLVSYGVNADAVAGTNDLAPVNTYDSFAGAPLNAGDFLEFCGTAAALTDVTITIRHTESNSQVAELSFATIAVCA